MLGRAIRLTRVKATEYEYLLGHFLCDGLLEASRIIRKRLEPVESLTNLSKC
jgi:hypothetical protein